MSIQFQVRLWSADNNRWRVLSASRVASARARIVRRGGYAEATIVLHGKPSDVSGLAQQRRIELYDGASGQRLYRGYIAKIDPSRGTPRQTTVTCWGISQRAGRPVLRRRFAFPAPGRDVAQVFADIANYAVLPVLPAGSVVIDTQLTGQVVDYYDGWRKRCETVFAELDRLAGGETVWGGDVSAIDDATDQLYFRPFGDPESPDHTLHLPSPAAGARQGEEETTGIANVLDLLGGPARYPNLLAEACEGNTSFEYPVFAGEGEGNMLLTPGFEGRTNWSLSGGASYKSGSGSEPAAFEGADYVETDTNGEAFTQTRNPYGGGIVAGHDYTFLFRARREVGTHAVQGELQLEFLSGGGAQIATATIAVEPTSAGSWDVFSGTLRAPVGATGFRITGRRTGGAGSGATWGICWDAGEVFDASQARQAGWDLGAPAGGSGSVTTVDWQHIGVPAYHGAYSVAAACSASDSDSGEVRLAPLGKFGVLGGQSIRFSAWLRQWLQAGSSPKLQLVIEFYKSDNKKTGSTTRQTIAAATLTGAWQAFFAEATAPFDAVNAAVWLAWRGTGGALVDALSVRDTAAPAAADEFVEAGNFEAILSAADLFAAGTDEGDSADDWGAVAELEDQESITTPEAAESYATGFFRLRAVPKGRVSVEIFGRALALWPGQYVRAIGPDGADLLPSPLPIVEVEIVWEGGKLTHIPYLETEKPDPERKIREIVRKELQGKGGGSSNSFAGTGFSGGGRAGGGGADTEVEAARTRDASSYYSSLTYADLKTHINAAWSEVGAVGARNPAGTTNNAMRRWDATAGAWQQVPGALLDPSANASFAGTVAAGGLVSANAGIAAAKSGQSWLRGNSGTSGFSVYSHGGGTFLGNGVYLGAGGWTHDNGTNAYSQLLYMEATTGAYLYASSNSSASWNVANGVQLWSNTGEWKGAVNTTQGGSFAGSVSIGGNLSVTGNVSITGALSSFSLPNNVWITSAEGQVRLLCQSSSHTLFGTGAEYHFYNPAGSAAVVTFGSGGNGVFTGSVTSNGWVASLGGSIGNVGTASTLFYNAAVHVMQIAGTEYGRWTGTSLQMAAASTLHILGQLRMGNSATAGHVPTADSSGYLTLQAPTVPSHTHAASAITSGTMGPARLGSGTANSTTYLRGDSTWASIPTVVEWVEFTLEYDDLTEADTQQDFTLYTVPAGCTVLCVKYAVPTAFGGGTLTDLDVSVGTTLDPDLFLASTSLMAANGDYQHTAEPLPEEAGNDIILRATSTGDNVDAATNGAAEIRILISIKD